MCAGYKNCKFEQGYPACLINSCTWISENTEWCNRQQFLFFVHLESLSIEMFYSQCTGIISTQYHGMLKTSKPWWMLWKYSTNTVFHFFSVSDWHNEAPVKKQWRFWRMAGDPWNYDNSVIMNSSLEGLLKPYRHLNC